MDFTKDLASIIVDVATAAGIIGVAIWAFFRFNLTTFFRPVVEVRIAQEALLDVRGSKLIGLRLTIRNVSNVAAELIGARLAIVEVQDLDNSHLMTVKTLAKLASEKGLLWEECWEDRAKNLIPVADPYTDQLSDWANVKSRKKLQKEQGALLTLVGTVNPGEEDSITVPYTASEEAHGLDVFLEVEFLAEKQYFLFRRRRGLEGRRWFYDRRIVRIEQGAASSSLERDPTPSQG